MHPPESTTASARPKTGSQTNPLERARGRRRRWVAAGVVLVGGFMTSLVVLAALVQPPRPISIVAIGTDYAENLTVPHNAYGWNSLRAACRLGDDASSIRYGAGSLFRCDREPLRVGERFDFTQAADRLTSPVGILFVSLHGGADAEGAYLLREGASPYDAPESRLRVTDLLDLLAQLPASQQKLLVFDATAAAGNTLYGEAENGFAAALRELNDAIAAIPHLIVVSSSDLGERSWEEPSLGRTVFLHTFLESLRGAACDPDGDGRLSADELIAHVAATVSARVSVTRQRAQSLLVLPLGDEGSQRARGVEVALANPHYRPIRPSDQAVAPEAITKHWEHVERLATQLHRPETNAPVAWRRYRRLVLRQEQLLFAGATGAAQGVADTLSDLESELRREATTHAQLIDPVQLPRPNNRPALDRTADKAMSDLLAAPAGLLRVVADKTLAAVDADDSSALRRRLYDRLLQRVETDPAGSLRQAASIAEAISIPDQAPPAEAHLLTLLAEGLPSDLSDPAWSEPLRRVVGVQRLAAGALHADEASDHSLTPALLPWLLERHARADQRRRHGEDLLFGGIDYLPRATAELRAAFDLYTKIHTDAAILREAIGVRDAAFDRLPFYTDAVVQMRAVHGDDPAEIASLAEQVQSAWEAAHTLGDVLVAAEASPDDSKASIHKIAAATDAAEQPLERLHLAMRAWRSRLVTQAGASFCNNRDAALSVPDMAVGERLQLLGVCPPDAEESATDQRALRLCNVTQADWRAEETRRRARLALAAVGRRIQKQSPAGSLSFEQSLDLLVVPTPIAGNPEAAATPPVDLTAATRVARELLGLHGSVWSSIATTTKQSLSSELTAVEREHLAYAGAAVRRLAWGQTVSAAQSLLAERAQLQRSAYYAWQAERVLADGWGGAVSDRPAYFQLAATAYARLAEQALPGQPATDRLLERAATPFELRLSTPSRVNLVADSAADLPLGVAGSTPAGHAVVSVETSRELVLETPATDSRIVASLWANDPETTPAVVVRAAGPSADQPDSDTAADAVGSLTYRGWFRGHRAANTVPAFVHRVPDVEIDNPPRPAAAGVAIMAPQQLGDGRHDGGVALVIDASGSMGPVAGGGSFKYAEAVETLRSLLSETPVGVQVSVWVFGQAIGEQKTATVAEAAVERVLDPIRWDPNDPALLRQLADRLAYPRIEPWNESALARTLLSASRDLRGVSGYRAVIAITDGVDNRFANDAVANPQKESIGDVLRQELAGSGIALHVVGFRVAGVEQAAARKQFDFLDQLDPPGRWWEASEPAALAVTLRQVLGDHITAPLVARESQGIVRNVSDAFVTPATAAPVWPSEPLEPGLYALPRLAESAPQQTLLAGGDLLLLSAAKVPGNPAFRPASFSASQAPNKPAIETPGWRAALLNHRRLPDGSTSTLVAIEQRLDADVRSPSLLQVQRPGELWVEADNAGPTPHRVRWRRVEGYPAPCWEVLRRGNGAEATDPRAFKLWWTRPEGPRVTRAIRRGEEFERPYDLVGRSWDVEGRPVTIRRLGVESRSLPDPTGNPVRQSCLVIELDGGPPCGIRLQGVAAAGSRHQRYNVAERTVAIFWPVAPEQLRDQLDGIDLTSVLDLQSEAEGRCLSATFTDLAPASPGDLRPTPSVGWFGPQRN